MRFGLALLILAACSKAPGVEGDAAIDSPPSDAATYPVTGKYVLREVTNDSQHTPMITEVPVRSLALSVTLADGSSPHVDVQPDGTFSFSRAASDQPYRLRVVADGAKPVEYQLAAPHVDIAPPLWGRYDRTAVPANTVMSVTATGASSGTSVIVTTGLWTQTVRTNGNNGAFTLDWRTAGSLSGPIGLLDAAKSDRTYVVTYDSGGTNPPYTRITTACSADVSLTPGATTPASCTIAPVAQNRCIHVAAHVATELSRIAAATAGTFTYPTNAFNWIAMAAPTPSLGPGGAPWLAYDGGTPTTDIDRNMTLVGNPFPGHDVSIEMTVARARSLTLPGATATSLAIYTQHYVKPAPDCATTTDLSGVIAFPSLPALDGFVLGNDLFSLELDRSQLHDLTWSVASPGAVTYWVVQLHAVTNVGGATALDYRYAWVATDPHVTIDPALLESNTSYVVYVIASTVFVNPAQGDFRTIDYPAKPYATGANVSGMFRVTN
ncbi:MAG: hypothetical protein JWO36_5372 [Myxococcales bacterium]|nr:hypothetical protein [Myxococcales bacterium]